MLNFSQPPDLPPISKPLYGPPFLFTGGFACWLSVIELYRFTRFCTEMHFTHGEHITEKYGARR